MNRIRRELLNGLLVLVIASLLSVAFSAFQVSFNALIWVLILMGIAIAVSGYILFEITLGVITSAEDREKALAEAMRRREEEWLKRVGNPARLELGVGPDTAGTAMRVEAIKNMRPGSDLTIMLYISAEGGREVGAFGPRQPFYGTIMEQLNRGAIREYKRLLWFDPGVFRNNQDLKSGILHVGEGPGTVSRVGGGGALSLDASYKGMLPIRGTSCFAKLCPGVVWDGQGLYVGRHG